MPVDLKAYARDVEEQIKLIRDAAVSRENDDRGTRGNGPWWGIT